MESTSGCLVCQDPSTGDNPIVACVGCGIKVHKLCYGIRKQTNQWKCSPCQLQKTKYAACKLCMEKGGPLKQTTCAKWVHIICALFTSGVMFPNPTTMEPVDLTKVSASKKNKLCSFCYNSKGYANLCAIKDCKNRLHITCAQQHGISSELSH